MINLRFHARLWLSSSLMAASFLMCSTTAQAEPAGNCSKTGGVCEFKHDQSKSICTTNPNTYCVDNAAKKTTTCGEFWRPCAGSRDQNYYRTFWNPSYHGPRLDYCLDGVKECGLPVANHYCKLMGYDHAVQQAIAYNVGQTQAFLCPKPCKGLQCNGFQVIRCVAKFTHKPASSYYYRSQEFVFPRYEHSRVDWCYEDSKGCGKRAASSFCRRMGYSRAQDYKIQHHVTETRAIGNHRVCVGGGCNAFSSISCYR